MGSFIYGFAKNRKAKLSDDELEVYRRLVAAFPKADAAALQRLVDADELKVAKKALKYRSDALAVAHNTAARLHRAGVIDKGTMLEFDESCLTKVEDLSPSSAPLSMNSALAAAAEMNSSSQTVDEPSPSITCRAHSESSSSQNPVLTEAPEFATLQQIQPSTSAAKDALVVAQAPGGRPPTSLGSPRGTRGFGWWERRWGAPLTLGAHHDDD